MGTRTVWILLAFVLLLAGAALWQLDRESGGAFKTDLPLFDGVRPERVQSVRIDQLELGLQISIVRDSNGSWQIVDPLTFPAENGVLDRLLEVVSKNRALPVDEPDLAALSFTPQPRAVLEFVEALPTGERKLRLELGARDLDGKHVFARVDGLVVRTLRNLDSTLERDLSGWRQRRISNVDPASVVELRRKGKVALDPEQGLTDLGLEAGTTELGWRATLPWNAALDPGMVGALLSNACYMQARTFLADSAAELPVFGLEQPDLRLELVVADGSEEALLFKRDAQSESWICMREGSTHVFKVDDVGLVFLSIPTDGFIDRQLTRAARDDIESIDLESGGRRLSIRRDGQVWRLASKAGESTSAEVLADSEAVLDLLDAIENARVARFLIDAPRPEFTLDGEPRGIFVRTRQGEYSVEFGSEFDASPGVPGRLFRRRGEGVVGVVEQAVASFASRPWAELVERRMIKLPERGIAAIELSRGEFKRRFVRDANSGRWSPEGADVEAPKAFVKCVDRLLSLRADRAVELDAPFELSDPWQVVVIDGGNVRTSYALGSLVSDPSQHGFDDGKLRGIVTSSELLGDLARIP